MLRPSPFPEQDLSRPRDPADRGPLYVRPHGSVSRTVVAGEVRNLAQRSATAAREIKGLIEDSVQKVETGSELVNKSGETLGMIVTSVKRVTDIVVAFTRLPRAIPRDILHVPKRRPA